ncbi:hypothetical protein [Nocardia sp. NPDC051832]|uniref:hypothetical protein n=1 Tax=Nocardia sp. NPDC051832 TaxID=3155673 RepID=UPI00343ED6B1
MVNVAGMVGELERAFGGRAGRIGVVEGCSHCFSAGELERLSGAVDRISERELSRAVFKWGNTLDGSVEWMRWVAPRLLRGVAEGGSSFDPGLVGCRLFAAGWLEWPEAGAIRAFCESYWREVLSDPDYSVTRELCFLVPLADAVEPWLRIWSQVSGPVADRHFRELWQEWANEVLAGRLEVSCYREGPNIAPALADWIIAEAPKRIRAGDLEDSSDVTVISLTQLLL